MRASKSKKLRKALGMSVENLRTAEYNKIQYKPRLKPVKTATEAKYVEARPFTLINTSKNFYRKVKKSRELTKQTLSK